MAAMDPGSLRAALMKQFEASKSTPSSPSSSGSRPRRTPRTSDPDPKSYSSPISPSDRRDVGSAGIISGIHSPDMQFTGRGGNVYNVDPRGYRTDEYGRQASQWVSPTGEVWQGDIPHVAQASESGRVGTKDWDWYENEYGLDRSRWARGGVKPWEVDPKTGVSYGLRRMAMRNLGFAEDFGGGRGSQFVEQVGDPAVQSEIDRIASERLSRQRGLISQAGAQAPGDLVSSGDIGGSGVGGPTGTEGPVYTATPGISQQLEGYTRPEVPTQILGEQVQGRLAELAGPTPPGQEYAAETGMTEGQDINWQMQRIMSADNPVINDAMQRARERAYDEANARGLLNTSMAVEAAEKAAQEAAYSIALPMAQDAARAEQDIAKANLASRSSFQQLGMNIRSQEALQNSQLAAGEIIQTLNNNNAITLKEIDRITSLQGIQLEESSKRYMHQITESNKLALQTNASVATAYSNTVSAIGQVYQNPEMTSSQQNTAARWYMDQFQGYTEFQDVVNKTNYADQLDWGNTRGGGGPVAGDRPGGDQFQGAPDQFGPFGVVGAPGEIRTIKGGGYRGADTYYKWNSQYQTWQRTSQPRSRTSYNI